MFTGTVYSIDMTCGVVFIQLLPTELAGSERSLSLF